MAPLRHHVRRERGRTWKLFVVVVMSTGCWLFLLSTGLIVSLQQSITNIGIDLRQYGLALHKRDLKAVDYQEYKHEGQLRIEQNYRTKNITKTVNTININKTDTKSSMVNPSGKTKYVSLCRARLVGNHRTGNHLFMLSAMIHLASVTGRKIVMPRKGWNLDSVFDIDVERVDNVERDLRPCRRYITPRYDYDYRIDDPKVISQLSNSKDTILLCELSQTYLHAQKVNDTLRKMVRFKPSSLSFADSFLREHRKLPSCNNNCTQVGVHIRGSDFLVPSDIRFGISVVDASYIRHAFQYFIRRYRDVQFIVATEDWNWTNARLAELPKGYNIVRSVNHSVSEDLALLSSCDAVLMSTGSFGWWAGWLSNKPTVYYDNWPRNGSKFSRIVAKKNYYPPKWIPVL